MNIYHVIVKDNDSKKLEDLKRDLSNVVKLSDNKVAFILTDESVQINSLSSSSSKPEEKK